MESSDKYRFVSFCRSMDCKNTLELGLHLKGCGIENCVSGRKNGPCRIRGYRIHIILAGKGVLRMKKQSWDLSAGMIFVLLDGQEMEYEADQEDPWQYAWVSLEGSKISSCLRDAGFARSPVRECNCSLDCYVEIIDRILGASESTLHAELQRNSCLYELLALLVETGSTEKEKKYSDSQDLYVQNAIEYIHRNYSHIKVNDIAAYIGINRSYLTTIFKNKLNVSPQEYLVNYRLNKARQLLQTTDLSIQEIAVRVGYDNPLTFSKMFKNAFGVSPKYYRRDNRFVI